MAKRSPLATIFLTIFIDMLGVGVIIPIIPVLFFEADSSLFGPEVSQTFRSITYGFLIAAYPMMQFFGAPLLGGLSDKHGRKPVLLISLFGTLIGYLVFAYAVDVQILWLLFAARMLPGFTGGNIAVILSSIADVSSTADKAKNFGLVGAAFGIGFVVGPTLGGILADPTLVSWFNPVVPLLFVAGLTVINLLLVWFQFPETLKERKQTKLNAFSGFKNIAAAFQSPNLRKIFLVALLISLGFTFFTQFFGVYLIQEFGWQERQIGFLFGWVGIWLAITQGLIVRRMSGIVLPSRVLQFSIAGIAISIALLLVPKEAWLFYLIHPLIAITYGLTSPNLTSVISDQAGPQEQGKILGINQSMQSVGQFFPPIIAGYLNALDARFPLVASAALMAVAWLAFMVVSKRK
jgi:DHA1 family tetracycline resistance protein-like MFS transporter